MKSMREVLIDKIRKEAADSKVPVADVCKELGIDRDPPSTSWLEDFTDDEISRIRQAYRLITKRQKFVARNERLARGSK